jgi:hypothetical protein
VPIKQKQSAHVMLITSILFVGIVELAGAQKGQNGTGIPGCFVTDTVYHAVVNLKGNVLEIAYGSLPLVAVHFTPLEDSAEVADFAEKWRHETKSSWQTATATHVWAGRPQISDTVIRIVSEVASVDPIRIQRLLPERFDVELTGGFRLRVMTPAGNSAPEDFNEKWHTWKSRWLPFSRVTILEVLVSPEDAQTLYYGLEPGTPVVVSAPARAAGK